MEKIEIKNEIEIINETNIKHLIYEIRGQKVMLDFDLARIYGYTTKRFNEQVKNNIEKFELDFMFQITKSEFEIILMSKKSTSKSSVYNQGGTRKLPYAFTEQGIYMLMTVLRGELAIKQSKALIRTFKKMKDYVSSNSSWSSDEKKMVFRELNDHSGKIKNIEGQVKKLMKNFNDSKHLEHYLIKNGQRVEADIAFQEIYKTAKKSILLLDDYISIKTLKLLKVIAPKVVITIASDNISKEKITETVLEDFRNDTGREITIVPTHGQYHDRYIMIDNKTVYLCGSSSKDSGKRITTIYELEKPELYIGLFKETLGI